MTNNIAAIETFVFGVSARTNWIFVKVTSEDGLYGWGEASLNGFEEFVTLAVARRAEDLRGMPEDAARRLLVPQPHAPGGRSWHAATSAIEQALNDIWGKRAGRPAHDYFGPRQRQEILLYANINRATRDRSPEGCAKQAADALNAGFGAVKIAPFDGVLPVDIAKHEMDDAERNRRIAAGVERVAAIRGAIGDEAALLIDCHWRLGAEDVTALVEQLVPLRPHWIECPMSEHGDALADWARLRKLAAPHGVITAGCETIVSARDVEIFAAAGSHDVLMPDVKYCGGIAGIHAIAKAATGFSPGSGMDIAPHNPTGPVCTAASAHACAGLTNFTWLELQVGETPLYDTVVRDCGHRIADGKYQLSGAPGLGIDLDMKILADHPGVRAQDGLDYRLG
jgi:galactonate dehydratase